MIYLDIDTLNAKFWATPLTYKNETGATVILPDAQKLDENGPSADLDETQPFVRWTIDPGASAAVTTKPAIFKSLGVATLQIFIPQGRGSGIAIDIAEAFEAAFREFKSADKCLNVTRTQRNKGSDPKLFQLNVTVTYNSVRSA